MKNLFGNETVYICPHCGGSNVGTECSFYRYYNEPYKSPNFEEIIHQDSDWCYDCDVEIIVQEKK